WAAIAGSGPARSRFRLPRGRAVDHGTEVGAGDPFDDTDRLRHRVDEIRFGTAQRLETVDDACVFRRLRRLAESLQRITLRRMDVAIGQAALGRRAVDEIAAAKFGAHEAEALHRLDRAAPG